MSKISEAICYLFGAGEHYCVPPVADRMDFVIAVDGGLEYLERYNITPDLVVGDFDSVRVFPSQRDNMVLLPQEKNDTDMLAAIDEGWERKYRIFHIYGGTGGRFDHTLANVQCIANLAGRGGRGFLFEKDTVITAIRNSSIQFPSAAQGIVSVFSHSDTSVGVYEEGLKFPLENAILRNTYPLGISNEFTGVTSSVTVQSGTLIVIYPKKIQEDVTQ